MHNSVSRDDRRERRQLSPREKTLKRGPDKTRTRSPAIKRSRIDHTQPSRLPYGQHELSKHDLEQYKALFADYLQLQKRLVLSELADHEVKGRWKSFIGKWNRGELSEGWYDSQVLLRAKERSESQDNLSEMTIKASPSQQALDEPEDSGDDVGPHLPTALSHGPAIPSLQDLQYQRELAQQDRADLRLEHQQDRQLQRKANKERLDELVPRAEPGSRERHLEKKRDVALSNRVFADAKDAGATEIADSDLMGDDIDAYKAKLRAEKRQKNEREIRKEEVLRARAAEREERLAEHRRKEAKTMETLRALAQQRYGNA
ncbi:hypothetical protein AMS68_001281 [Peltaster fructicola]|uniref:Uncharacterized protein n=1 Tax=Peltaster fructicola TaxID=286661 RepID=A0A6H0XM11_9PEZI|nr:hypothetical protein AMS68_001281 [Peltaster fructicola]